MNRQQNARRRRRGGGGNQNQNNQSRRVGAIRANPDVVTRTGWYTIKSMPEIKKDQNLYEWKKDLLVPEIPGLHTDMETYQTYEIISIGARFKPALTHSPGLVGLLVWTQEHVDKGVVPATINHQWMKKNGCNIVQLIRQASSPPSNNTPSNRGYRQTNVTTARLGKVMFCWEGPKFAEDQSHIGEIEVFINVRFSGLK